MAKISVKPKAVIMDVEGTTSDSTFISKKLFPFIRSNITKFLDDTYESPETKEIIKRLRQLKEKVPDMPMIVVGNKEQVIKSVAENIKWQIKVKHKTSSEHKSLELLCWLWAYDKKLIKSQIFDDVSPVLHNWKLKAIKTYAFSSGMAIAQRLLFVNTNHGNIDCLIDDYFDSSIGSKKDPDSYRTIANRIGPNIPLKQILFITDDTAEGKAAIDAGISAAIIKRPGNKANDEYPEIPRVKSFNDFDF